MDNKQDIEDLNNAYECINQEIRSFYPSCTDKELKIIYKILDDNNDMNGYIFITVQEAVNEYLNNKSSYQ